MLDQPEWFRSATAMSGDRRSLVRDDCEISYRTWGEPGRPLAVLVHGRGAHARWWDHVAPLLSQNYRLVALDLAGHGDSGWRETYGFHGWAQDVMAVAREESGRPPILIGHSMGGTACVVAAMHGTAPVRGLVMIDSPVGVAPSADMPSDSSAVRNPARGRTYASREEAVRHFKVLPEDPVTLDFVERHIAEHSVRSSADEWVWKFDPMVRPPVFLAVEELSEVACPVVLVRGERGLASAETTAAMAARLGFDVTQMVIPDVGHHVAVGQPIALVSILRLLLDLWRPVEGRSAA